MDPMRPQPKSVMALVALLVGGCASHSALQASKRHEAQGNPRMAYVEVDLERTRLLTAGEPIDPELEARWRRLRIRYLIDEARELIYSDREERALKLLDEVGELAPDHEEAASLAWRAHRKLAARATRSGQDGLAAGDLAAALAAFQTALHHVEDYPPATEGLAAVHAAYAKLHREAQEQFLEAIRKLPQLRFDEVRWHAAIAAIRNPELPGIDEVRTRAEHELAQAARDEADRSRQKGAYGAALMQYRRARALWPGLPGLDDTIEMMQREVQAQWKIERASLEIRSGRIAVARALLADAFELSTLERTVISEMLLEARKREGELTYTRARDLELQGLKQEALDTFEALVKDWPDGLRDEKTRVSALRSDIEGAEREVAAGEAKEQAGDLEQALEHYRSAATYYEAYGDVKQRIERVQAALQGR